MRANLLDSAQEVVANNAAKIVRETWIDDMDADKETAATPSDEDEEVEFEELRETWYPRTGAATR